MTRLLRIPEFYILVAFIVFAFVSCLTSCTIYTPPPDSKAARWVVKGPIPERFENVQEAVRRALPCKLRNDAWSGTVTFVEGSVACGDIGVAGCWDGAIAMSPIFRVSYTPSAVDGALIHELGHYGFSACGDGSTTREPAWFHEWIETVRRSLR